LKNIFKEKREDTMFIAIDIGNTHTVIGAYEEETLKADLRIPSTFQQTEDEIGAQTLIFLKGKGIDTEKIDGVGISSVVPDLTSIFASLSKKLFHQEPLIVSANLNLGITIHYDNPKSIGADRLCNAVAGYAKYGGPLIIIDFGTATTYDIMASNGDYLGGVIAPGIETSAADLHKRTARLPIVDLHLPHSIIGTDTVSSMQTGILWGAIDAMTGMVHRIQSELQHVETKKPLVIATGGFSKFVADHSQLIQRVEISLVLDGIRLIYNRVHYKGEKPT
jgi:type III pantothenate kinase